MKKVTALLTGILSLVTLTGCGGSSGDKIKISAVKLGYGTKWLSALTTEYTKKTGIKFDYTEIPGQSGNSNLDQHIRSLSGDSDIYALRPGSFYEYLYRGTVNAKGNRYPYAYEPLTDIFKEPFEGEVGNNTIEKKIDSSFLDYVTFNDDYFGLPWANGFVSFVRHLDVWKKFGFTEDQYPRTTDEMFEMMDAMNAKIKTTPELANFAPMIYSASDEYYTTVMGAWFAQYEGDNIEKFYAGRDPDGRRSVNLFTYDGVYETLSVLQKMIEKKDGKYTYQSASSDKSSFTQMQNYFISGKTAAFCVNGTWLEVENAEARKYDLDYIKVPLISSITDKLSKDYTETQLREMVSFVDAHPTAGDNTAVPGGVEVSDIEIVRKARNTGSYMRTDYDHLFVVPAWSTKKAEAKAFLKWTYSDEALQLFYKTMNGHHLPANPSTGSYDSTDVELSSFRVSCNAAFEEGNFCPYLINTAKDKIFSVAYVQSNFSNATGKNGNVVNWLINGATPDQIIEWNTKYLTDNWSSIENAIGKGE